MSKLQDIIDQLASETVAGATGVDIDRRAAELIKEAGCRTAFLGYNGFPNTICISINNEVIHGIPDLREFKEGDLVKLDLGLIESDGQYDDGATTVLIGEGSKLAKKLIRVTKEALDAGCAMAKAGYTTNDIGRAIFQVVNRNGFVPVNNYGGHGIGTELHMEPHVPNYSVPTWSVLKAGQRIAIEPMVSTKGSDTYIAENGWTVILKKNGLAAHFERTVTIS